MSNQVIISSGAKVRELEGVLTGTSGIVSSVPLGAANGVATLDALGKVPLSQLPASVVTYLGTWNAATNTPTLANGTGDVGDLYICNVAGTVNFGAGPITFAVGDWVIYSGTTWQKSSGQNGTVTSVAASITGNSVGITGSPITTAGTLAFAFAGTNLQYINGAGNLTTFPTLISSIGLSMPSAFSVANSPLTANGTIAVTGAGTANQYIRGDGSLATFPATGGGGSAVYYYLNGSVNASVTGYKQMSNTAVVGTGTDFSLVGNGLIAEFLTDAGNPNRLLIPAGAWNFEMYFSMSSSGGNQKFYVELLKYNGTTFTSIASNSTSPEEITGGTTTDLYLTSLGVPETTFLVTDRLALRIYIVDNSVGRTTTLHTEDNHLCQVTTTFSSGIAALNGLTANTQYFAVGTSGSDFNISSVLDTHTFNIPTASATKRGLLSSADWSTFNGKVPYTGANADVNLGSHLLTALGVSANSLVANGSSAPSGNSGYLFLKQGIAPFGNDSGYNSITANSTKFLFQADAGSSNNKIAFLDLSSLTNNTSRTYTLPDASGTISLTSDLSGYVPTSRTISTTSPLSGGGALSGNLTLSIVQSSATVNGYLSSTDWSTFNGKQNALTLTTTGTSGAATLVGSTLNIPNYGSALSGYVPYNGATTNVNLGTNTLSGALFSSTVASGSPSLRIINSTTSTIWSFLPYTNGTESDLVINYTGTDKIRFVNNGSLEIGYTSLQGLYKLDVNGTGRFVSNLTAASFIKLGGTSSQFLKADGSVDSSTYLTTSVASSTYLPLTGGTLTGTLRVQATTTIYNASEARLNLNTNPDGEATTGYLYATTSDVTLGSVGAVYLQALGKTTLQVLSPYSFLSGTASGDGGNVFISTSIAQAINIGGGISLGGWSTSTGSPIVFGRVVGRKENGTSGNTAGYLSFETSSASPNQTFERLRISSTGAATFLSSIAATSATFTLANDITLNARSGASGSFTYWSLGRTSSELEIGVAAASNQFFTGTAAGDVIIKANGSSNKLMLGYGSSSPTLTLASTGAATFSSSVTATSYSTPSGSLSPYLDLTNSSTSGLKITYDANSAVSYIDNYYSTTTSVYSYGDIVFRTKPSAGTTLTSALTIKGYTGNVGIGTSSPLAVSGYTVLSLNNATNGGMLDLQSNGTSAGLIYAFSNSLNIGSSGTAPLVFLTASGNERMRITSEGDVCIASTAPVSTRRELRIGGNAGGSRISLGLNGTNYSALITDSGGNFYMAQEYNDSAIKLLCINYNNGVYLSQSATSWTANSDERLKNINTIIENAVDKLMTLRAVNFSWKSDENKKENLGLIAQDVEKVFPQIIDKNKLVNQKTEIKDETEYLGVRYVELVPVLIAAIQELKQELDTLNQLVATK